MKKIVIIGAGHIGITTARILEDQGYDVVIFEEPNDKIMKTELTMEIKYKVRPILDNTYVPTKREIESYHPFSKFFKKPKRGKGGRL